MEPKAAEWDKTKHFPIDVYKRSAELGFGGIYVSEANGGCGLGRLEASLIFENGKQNNFDACILVKTDKVTKLHRLKQSRQLKEDELQKIIDSQMPDDEKAKLADYIIENSSHKADLENSVLNLIRFLSQKFSPSSF